MKIKENNDYKTNENKKIAFFFGAGAEGKNQLDLPMGTEFKKDIILSKNVKKIFYLINGNEDYKIDDSTILHHSSSSILYQTIKEHSEKFKCKNEDIVLDYINYKDGKKENIDSKISEDFKKFYKEKFYDKIKEGKIKESNIDENKKSDVEKFLEHAAFFSFVDQYFNYLRNPKKYKIEVSKVMKLYFSAFMSIINAFDNEKIIEIINNDMKEGDPVYNRKILLEKIIKNYQDKIIKDNKSSNVYYNVIKDAYNEKNKNKDFDIFVITTNYTKFAQEMIGLKDNQIAYVHGKLELFENVSTKELKPVNMFEGTDVIFPYLMIQSGVKPIFSRYQILEWAKAIKVIMDYETLIILGYGVNSDDEHIISLLRERLKENKKIIFIIHKDISSESERIKKIFEGYESYLIFKETNELRQTLLNI